MAGPLSPVFSWNLGHFLDLLTIEFLTSSVIKCGQSSLAHNSNFLFLFYLYCSDLGSSFSISNAS